MGRRDGRLGLGDQLLIVVRLQVPDVDSTALITHNEFCLGCKGGEMYQYPCHLKSPLPPLTLGPMSAPHLVGMQTHAINGCIHLEDALTLQVPGPVGS